MRAQEFITDDTINRNPGRKVWQIRADDDLNLKYETPEIKLKDAVVVTHPEKVITAFIQGTPVKSFDPLNLESFTIRYRKDKTSPFYRTDTQEPVTKCDYISFNSDGSVIGYNK